MLPEPDLPSAPAPVEAPPPLDAPVPLEAPLPELAPDPLLAPTPLLAPRPLLAPNPEDAPVPAMSVPLPPPHAATRSPPTVQLPHVMRRLMWHLVLPEPKSR
jgi:hypothetical protein